MVRVHSLPPRLCIVSSAVEQCPYKAKVVGSIPTRCTNLYPIGEMNITQCYERWVGSLILSLGAKFMESNAAVMVLRPALKTGFSEMGWGSTPLLSAKFL